MSVGGPAASLVPSGITFEATRVVGACKLVGATLKVVCTTAGIKVTVPLLEEEELGNDELLDEIAEVDAVVLEVVGGGASVEVGLGDTEVEVAVD